MPMATAAATAGDAAALALRLQLLANFSQELLCLFDSEQQLLCFNASRNKLGARVAKQLSLTAASCEMGPRASLAQLLGAVLGEREGMACYLTLQDGLTSDSVGERSASAHDGHGHAYEVSAARCQDPATSKQNAIKLSIRATTQERCHVTSEIAGLLHMNSIVEPPQETFSIEDNTVDGAIVRNLMQLLGTDDICAESTTTVVPRLVRVESKIDPAMSGHVALQHTVPFATRLVAASVPLPAASTALPDDAKTRRTRILGLSPSKAGHYRRRSTTYAVAAIPERPAHDITKPSAEVLAVLETAERWHGWDAFKLARVTDNAPLATITYWCLKRMGLIKRFDLIEPYLIAFLHEAESRYPDNRYHNRSHAADVVQSVHVMMTTGGLREIVDDVSLLGIYLAAATHDLEHGGLNNDFLIKTQNSIALCYHDMSPLENHHCAAATRLLLIPNLNFLANMPADTLKVLRKTMIEAVLATDMAKHFHCVDAWAEVSHCFMPDALASGGASSGLNPVVEGRPAGVMSKLLQMCLKCADAGHLAADLPMHKHWVECLEAEFFLQVGFFKVVALPMYNKFCSTFAQLQPMLDNVRHNHAYWCEMEGVSPDM